VHTKIVLAKKLFYQLKICLNPKKFGFFWAKLFLGALFTKVICTFLKSVRKDVFFDTPFDLVKRQKSRRGGGLKHLPQSPFTGHEEILLCFL
jgi:hypothetical protein